MRLMYNMYSLSILKNYKNAVADGDKSIGNISSGKKLNSAKDNPSKIVESDKLKINIQSRQAAKDGVQDTNSMIQTFDGAYQEMNNNISRLKQLVTQAGNGSISESDRADIQKEIEGVKSSINDLANNTSFNGIKLSLPDDPNEGTSGTIDTNTSTIKSTIGVQADEFMEIPFYHVTTKGLNIDNIDVSGANPDIDSYLNQVDAATKQVDLIRSKYGAIETNLDDTLNSFDDMNDTLQAAQSDLEDSDVSTEMEKYSSSEVMVKAGISLMSQSNELPQDCVNLLISSL